MTPGPYQDMLASLYVNDRWPVADIMDCYGESRQYVRACIDRFLERLMWRKPRVKRLDNSGNEAVE